MTVLRSSRAETAAASRAIAAAKPVGAPRPKVEADDADQRRDLHPAAISAEIDHELGHQHRRDEHEDCAVHAVKVPAEAIGPRDVPMRRGDPACIGYVAKELPTQVLCLERTGSCIRTCIRRRNEGIRHRRDLLFLGLAQ
jgi:hypothetical protein